MCAVRIVFNCKKDRTWVWGVLIGLPQAQRDGGRSVGQEQRTQDEQRQTSDGV